MRRTGLAAVLCVCGILSSCQSNGEYRPPMVVYDITNNHDTPLAVIHLEMGIVTGSLPAAKFLSPMAFSPDGRTLAGTYGSGMLKLWDVGTGRLLHTVWSCRPEFAVFSPDGTIVAVSTWEDWGLRARTTIIDVSTGTQLREIEGDAPLAISPDGTLLASGFRDRGKSVVIWDLASGEVVSRLGGPKVVRSMAFRSDSRTLATVTNSTKVEVWDVQSGNLLQKIGRPGQNDIVSFTHKRRDLVLLEDEETLAVWNTTSGWGPWRLGGMERKQLVALSLDDKFVAWLRGKQTVEIWEIASGRLHRNYGRQEERVLCIGFSESGETLISASDDGTIRLWSVLD